MRNSWDLYLLNLATALLLGIDNGIPGSPVRVLLGLAVVLFCPGYALTAALYPGRTDIQSIERLALSFGFSLAVVPLVGLILNFSPWGIRQGPVLAILAMFIAICSLLAARARRRLPPTERFNVAIHLRSSALASRLSGARMSVAAAVVLLVASICFRLYAAPRYPGETFTEFYVLGGLGNRSTYPTRVAAGQSADAVLGIVNHESQRATYKIVIREANRALATIGPIVLRDGQRWEGKAKFAPAAPAGRDDVEFLLFKNDNARPYRLLRLWINVT